MLNVMDMKEVSRSCFNGLQFFDKKSSSAHAGTEINSNSDSQKQQSA